MWFIWLASFTSPQLVNEMNTTKICNMLVTNMINLDLILGIEDWFLEYVHRKIGGIKTLRHVNHNCFFFFEWANHNLDIEPLPHVIIGWKKFLDSDVYDQGTSCQSDHNGLPFLPHVVLIYPYFSCFIFLLSLDWLCTKKSKIVESEGFFSRFPRIWANF